MKFDDDLLQRIKNNDKTLTTLELQHSYELTISAAEVITLAEVLAQNTSITSLDLTGNSSMSDNGVIMLAKALAQNQTLNSLSLKETNLGAPGLIRLSKALAENLSLTYLDLSGNFIMHVSALCPCSKS